MKFIFTYAALLACLLASKKLTPEQYAASLDSQLAAGIPVLFSGQPRPEEKQKASKSGSGGPGAPPTEFVAQVTLSSLNESRPAAGPADRRLRKADVIIEESCSFSGDDTGMYEYALKKIKTLVSRTDPTERYDINAAELSSGKFGQVFCATDKYTEGRRVAIKKISLAVYEQEELFRVANEIEIMRTLNHRNIVQFYDAYLVNERELWLVM